MGALYLQSAYHIMEVLLSTLPVSNISFPGCFLKFLAAGNSIEPSTDQ